MRYTTGEMNEGRGGRGDENPVLLVRCKTRMTKGIKYFSMTKTVGRTKHCALNLQIYTGSRPENDVTTRRGTTDVRRLAK